MEGSSSAGNDSNAPPTQQEIGMLHALQALRSSEQHEQDAAIARWQREQACKVRAVRLFRKQGVISRPFAAVHASLISTVHNSNTQE